VELANSITDLIIPATDPTIVSALALTLLRLTSLFLFVARPSVLILIPSIVANPGLLDLLNNGLHVHMVGTLRSQMSMSSPLAKVVTQTTNVGTSLPTPEPDTTDEAVSDLALT
jgi:hypothetical protein